MFTPGGYINGTVGHTVSDWGTPERLRAFVRDFPGLFFLVDANGCILTCNTLPERLRIDAAVDGDLLNYVESAHHSEITEAIRSAISEGETRQIDIKLAGPDGPVWYAASIGPVFENNLATTAAIVCVNISQLRHDDSNEQCPDSRYRVLAESSTDVIMRCKIDGSIRYVSPACRAVTGYTQADLVGRRCFDLISPEDRETAEASVSELRTVGSQRRTEFRMSHKDGRAVWIEMTARLVQPDPSFPPELICALRDISRRQKTVAALRESEERYRSVVESTPMGMLFYELVSEEQLVLIGANPAADSILGLCHTELIGKTIEEVYPALADTEIPERYREIAKSGIKFHSDEVAYDDGRVQGVFEVHAFQSGPRRVSVMFLDVTERRIAVDAIRESEEKFREIAELLPIGVYELDNTGQLLYVNNQSMEYFGVTADDLNRGTCLLDLFCAEDRARASSNIRRLLGGGRTGTNEYLVQRKDGSKFPARFHSTAVFRDGQICGIRGVVRDITDEKQRELESIRNQKLESVGLLAGGIAHDFNNLLTGILGNITLACQDLPPDDDRHRRLLDAERAVETARGLTSQLLTFASGGAPVIRSVELHSFLEKAVTHAARATGIDSRVSLPENLPLAEVDAVQMGQVLHCLVRNAGEAMPDGGTVHVSVESASDPSGKPQVVIAVRDSGAGIDPEMQQHVFDPYFTTKEGHLGLGLATAYSIVKKHGGSLTATSEPGIGSVFTIVLPARAGKIAVVPAGIAMDPKSTMWRILVMDDEDFIRDLATRLLSRAGWEVECVADGTAALVMYQDAQNSKTPFDLVILDLSVAGGMGGKETIARLREVDPNVRAIVCSGYSNDPVLANYRRYGFAGIVEKPYKPDDLLQAIRDVLLGTAAST